MQHSIHRRLRAEAVLAEAAFIVFMSLVWLAPARADGYLEVSSAVPGALRLESALGREHELALEAGRAIVRCLPAGEYAARFRPSDSGAGESGPAAVVRILDRLTASIAIDPTTSAIRQADSPGGAQGSVLLLDSDLLSSLPGENESILTALDTRVRWRPSVRFDGMDVAAAAERIAILPGAGSGSLAGNLGLSWIALSASGAPLRAAAWNLSLAPCLPVGVSPEIVSNDRDSRPELRAAGDMNNFEGRGLDADLLLRRIPLAGRRVRGRATIRYADLGDASPRSEGGGALPHNDARVLDVASQVEIGPEDSDWTVRADIASRGWERYHFAQIYRRDVEHAPYEETALFAARAALDLRLGDRMQTEVFAGYDRYLTQFSDGQLKGNLSLYPQAGNGDADPSGLYWQGSRDETLASPHVFDYLLRKYAATWRAGVSLLPAGTRGSTFWRCDFEGDRFVYRRYENFSPAAPAVDPYRNTLYIGYDESGATRTRAPHAPGEPMVLRGSIELHRRLDATWRAEGAVGGFFMDARDSSLVDLAHPAGADFTLTANDFERSPRHFRPEGSLALRGRLGAKIEAWGLAYRHASMPPLEALYDPRAHLAVSSPEGIMGNPALAPELESGMEIGFSRPVGCARRTVRLTAAAYAARIDDALSLAYARFASSSGDTVIATLANQATSRQYGVHVALEKGGASDRVRALLSYDLSRTESDRFEPSLLDNRWIYPDLAPGEYESEGYAGPLGGILDPFFEPSLESGGYRPSNLDRPHQLSLAFIYHDPPPTPDAGWLAALARGWTLGALARFESGRPYTQTKLYPAAVPPDAENALRGPTDPAWAEPVASRNAQRMDPTFEFDLALTRRLSLGSPRILFSLTAFNVLGVRNAAQVYRSTGDPRDDGCLDNARCRQELPPGTTDTDYRERLLDPLHFGRPRVLQLAVGLEFI